MNRTRSRATAKTNLVSVEPKAELSRRRKVARLLRTGLNPAPVMASLTVLVLYVCLAQVKGVLFARYRRNSMVESSPFVASQPPQYTDHEAPFRTSPMDHASLVENSITYDVTVPTRRTLNNPIYPAENETFQVDAENPVEKPDFNIRALFFQCYAENIEELPDVLVDKISLMPDLLTASRAENTFASYKRGFKRWRCWALSNGLNNGTVCRFHISDSDANDIIKVNPGNDKTSEYFNIELSGSGNDVWVNVTVKKPLDRETLGSVLKISLSITDNQHNQVGYDHSVYIEDVNDCSPEFQNLPYTLVIPELPCNKTPVTVYTDIHATDKDSNANGRVRYLMEPKAQSPESRQKYKETFSIDPVTGSVSLNQCLDYESNSYYQFIVTAKDLGPDGGLNSTAEFTIHVKDVQDEPPFFTGIHRKPIKANTPKGFEVARVDAVDGDPGVSNKIHYSITYSSCGDGLFIINSATGVIYTSRNIDRNSGTIRQQSGYCTVTVEASEIQKVNETQYGNTTASTNVTITLQDFNAHQPTTTDVTGVAASTLQPTKQTLPSLNCTEPWNFQSPCNESTVQAGVTKFPHPASHHKFLICDASGKTYSAYCPPNEVFHAGCSSCAPPLQRFSESCQLFKDDFTNPCSKENVIAGNLTFPYPNSSTKYIRCDTLGNAWVEECLSGSLWDQANLVCMLPAAYNPCHRRGSMVQSLFPHYCNPRLYVQCGNNQQPFVHTCQKNYVFLQWDLTCIPPGFPGSEHLRYTCN